MKPALWLLTTVAVVSPLARAQSSFDQTPLRYASSRPIIFDQPTPQTNARPLAAPAPADTAVLTSLPQAALPTDTAAPADDPPQPIEMGINGGCQSVHAGDLVHFSLEIESAQDARSIFTDLQLTSGHMSYKPNNLPLPGTGNVMGGGGVAMRDGQDRNLYHFAFVVPDVLPGVYRTLGIAVHGDYGAAPNEPMRPVGIPLHRHAASQVQHYCLVVFGGGSRGHRPVVTEFKHGPIDRAAMLPSAQLPRPPANLR